MRDPNKELYPVEEVDRNSAAEFYRDWWGPNLTPAEEATIRRILDGTHDHTTLVQSYAYHRKKLKEGI